MAAAVPESTAPEGLRVVVGVDGSPGSRTALLLALTMAAQRAAALEVVATYPVPLVWTGGLPIQVPDVAAVRASTQARTRDFVAEVCRDPAVAAFPGTAQVDLRFVIAEGPPVPVLLERCRDAALLVVGSRGRGAVRSALLGSVALHCVSQASCPVVVAHPAVRSAFRAPRVVVGVDGSQCSRLALAAALGEAQRMRAEVTVVGAYVFTDHWAELASVVVPPEEEARADQQRRLDQVVAEAMDSVPGAAASVRVTTEVAEGPAAEVLIHRAVEADLLIVGSRGRGAIRGLLLGSVALHCAMHAPVPVMVVHGPRSRPTTADLSDTG